jgi:hypothetical protein
MSEASSRATEEEQRITKALTEATEIIKDLRYKLDLATETLEEYADHVLFEIFEWAREPATKTLSKIK